MNNPGWIAAGIISGIFLIVVVIVVVFISAWLIKR